MASSGVPMMATPPSVNQATLLLERLAGHAQGRQRENVLRVAHEMVQAITHVLDRLFACLRQMHEAHEPPIVLADGLAMLGGFDLNAVPVMAHEVQILPHQRAKREQSESVTASKHRAGRRGRRRDADVEIGIRRELALCVDKIVTVGLHIHHFAADEIEHHADIVVERGAELLRLQPDHGRIGRQRTGPEAQHHAPAQKMIGKDDPVCDPERVVIRDRDDSGPKLDVARECADIAHELDRLGDDLGAAGMVFADPRLVVAEIVEQTDGIDITLERGRRVPWRRGSVERRHEDAETEACPWCVPFPRFLSDSDVRRGGNAVARLRSLCGQFHCA